MSLANQTLLTITHQPRYDNTAVAKDPFYAAIREFHWWYEVVVGSVSYVFNFIVAYLSLTTKNRTMKRYCLIILMNVLGDLIYNTLNVITMIIVEVRSGVMYLVNAGPFEHAPNPYAALLTAFWLSGMYVTLVNVVMQFLYRYNVMCKSRKWTSLEFLGMYCAALLFAFCQGFASMLCLDQMDEHYTEILSTHPMYTWNTPSYTAGDPRNFRSLSHFIGSQLAVLAMYVVVIHTGKKINQTLRTNMPHMSKKSLDSQRKLTRVMILQAIYPGIVVGAPIVVATACTQLRLDLPLIGLYCVTSISLIPVINSVTVIIVITPFRNRIAQVVMGLSGRRPKARVRACGSEVASSSAVPRSNVASVFQTRSTDGDETEFGAG